MNVIVENWRIFLFGQFPAGPLGGFALTLCLSIGLWVASLFLGIVMAACASASAPLGWTIRFVVLIVRGVPSVVFLFWIYFFLPRLTGASLSPLESAFIALFIYHGAYMSEDVRGGLRAVPRGQRDAAAASGLSALQTMRHIVIPQAVRAVIPSLTNRSVNLFMYTSIVSLVGVTDFMRVAVLVNNRELIYPIQIFLFVGVTYLVCCLAITFLGRRLERSLSHAPRI